MNETYSIAAVYIHSSKLVNDSKKITTTSAGGKMIIYPSSVGYKRMKFHSNMFQLIPMCIRCGVNVQEFTLNKTDYAKKEPRLILCEFICKKCDDVIIDEDLF